VPQDPLSRGQWKSRIGFILAASGSAIGLGNIVFFAANAYSYGGGAFYLPYLIGLFAVGIPVMILEFGLGTISGGAFPEALFRVAGKKGEFAGWWSILNAAFITMWYITILAWVIGMLVAAFGKLWLPSVAVPAFGLEAGTLDNPMAFFFDMLSSWYPLFFVVIIWMANIVIVRRGAETIEQAARVFVPLMWIFMFVLIIRGLTLPNGFQGVMLLFTPDFSVMKNPIVWRGAFSQIFFTLSLGFGVMTAYASYLPRKTDHTQNAVVTSFLNCGFEYIAGLAVFSLLFVFSVVPRASTIAMMFFVLPQGIAQLPGGAGAVISFGAIFFALLLIAGLTSSISLIEALTSALRDKYKVSRKKCLAWAGSVGVLGSMIFALPLVVDPGLSDNGTMGFTLLDVFSHWNFSYGLLMVGLIECVLAGWVMGAGRIRKQLNANSKRHIGPWFDVLVKYVIPILLLFILGWSVKEEINELYGSAFSESYGASFQFMRHLPIVAVLVWLVGSGVFAAILTKKGSYDET
jgi:NSS family neurotransmitter:Na+ symporter